MKSSKPIILATAVAICLFGHDAVAQETQAASPVAAASATAPTDAPVLIASSAFRPELQQDASPAIQWDPGKRGARDAARQGPDALRRFVERTRTIYALQYSDFAPLVR